MNDKDTIRVIVMVLLVLGIVALLCSCGKPDTKRVEMDRFMLVEEYNDAAIYVDTCTGVEYACYNGKLTVLLDSYGRPLVWPAFDAREDRLNADR